ncbi:MAG: AtpZ/AtpI family protein [Candidatus Melainabacteria bacterium]|nr:AtpZ/AtpI family protein [Candidatus Melainabacteria bacterium]
MKPQDDLIKAFATAGDAVLGAAILTGLGAWSGFWLDDKLHTSPWLAIFLALLGSGLGLARMVLKATELERKSSSSKKTTSAKNMYEPDSWTEG